VYTQHKKEKDSKAQKAALLIEISHLNPQNKNKKKVVGINCCSGVHRPEEDRLYANEQANALNAELRRTEDVTSM